MQKPEEQLAYLVLYDRFRAAALRQDWTRANTLYEELNVLPLPEELARALAYHAALVAYDAADWRLTVTRSREAISADPNTEWRPSLYELLGLAQEQLREPRAALAAYAEADLPSTRLRARRLIDDGESRRVE